MLIIDEIHNLLAGSNALQYTNAPGSSHATQIQVTTQKRREQVGQAKVEREPIWSQTAH